MENIVRRNLPNIPQEPTVIQYQTPEILPEDVVQSLNIPQPAQQTHLPVQNNATVVPIQSEEVNQYGQPDETGRTFIDYLNEDGFYGKQSQQESREQAKQRESIPIFDKAKEAVKWTGETVKNTLIDRPLELASGAGEAFIHPIRTVGKPLWNYTKDRLYEVSQGQAIQALGRTGADVLNMFASQPITGQKIEDISLQSPATTLQNWGEHIHEGGLLDTYLALLPTPAGKVINKGIATGVKGTTKGLAKGIDKLAPSANLEQKMDSYFATRRAKKDILKEGVIERIETTKRGQEFKKELLNTFKKNNITTDEFEELVKHMEGFEGKDLSQLPENLKPKYEKLVPILEDYDNLIQKYLSAEPGNLQEIYQHGVRKSQGTANPMSYQFIKDTYEKSGLLELGQYVDKTTGKIIKQDNYLKALSENAENPIGLEKYTNKPVEFDLRNTKFEIPEENLEILAQLAMDSSNPERAVLAKHLFESYGLANQGLLHRISHGLAPVQKIGKVTRTAERNKENLLATERIYGDSTARDIAQQWLEPDNLFQYAIKNVLRTELLKGWQNEIAQNGMIAMKDTRPSDLVYITKDVLNDSTKLKNIKNWAKETMPENVDPSELVAIDKHILKAYDELFFNRGGLMSKLPPVLQDLISLFKQKLLISGTYLGGNFMAGLHQLITQSNVHLLEDVSSAIKTRGSLAKQIGAYRPEPIVGDIKYKTKPGTFAGETIRAMGKGYEYVGANLAKHLDVKMQNMFAEASAHSIYRRMGIPFENRNLEWMKQNLTKEQIYQSLNDIEKMALIYGDETFLPRGVIDAMSIGNPFFRWVDQATLSSIDLFKKAPAAYGYLQGAVLGGYVWSQNEANAKGMGISNPQSGKMYKFDAKTGNTKVTENEVIPVLTSLKALKDPGRFLTNASQNALLSWVTEFPKAQTQYGKIKERKNWKDIIPDYQRGVRYKNGIVQDNMEIDEMGINALKETVLPFFNKTALPLWYSAIGQQSYLPYSDTLFTSPKGDPNKPYGAEQVVQRLMTEYEHPAYPGIDIPITARRSGQLERTMKKRKSRSETLREDRERNNIKGGNSL